MSTQNATSENGEAARTEVIFERLTSQNNGSVVGNPPRPLECLKWEEIGNKTFVGTCIAKSNLDIYGPWRNYPRKSDLPAGKTYIFFKIISLQPNDIPFMKPLGTIST